MKPAKVENQRHSAHAYMQQGWHPRAMARGIGGGRHGQRIANAVETA